MSKLALHIHHFKRGAVGAVAGHNLYKRGKKDTHSNQDIDPERSQNNLALLVPGEGLYKEVKTAVEGSTGRVTANSIWMTEWIVYPPEELQNPKTADKDEVERYFNDVVAWMKAEGYDVKMAVVHMDESTVHAHIDTVPLTKDNKLSRKELYTRSALNGIHTDLAKHLQDKGWDIQRGESTEGKQVKSQGVIEYKKQAEREKKKLLKEIEGLKETVQKQQQLIDSAAETVARITEINNIEIKKIPFSDDGRGNLKELEKMKAVAAKDWALEHQLYNTEKINRKQAEELERLDERCDELIVEKRELQDENKLLRAAAEAEEEKQKAAKEAFERLKYNFERAADFVKTVAEVLMEHPEQQEKVRKNTKPPVKEMVLHTDIELQRKIDMACGTHFAREIEVRQRLNYFDRMAKQYGGLYASQAKEQALLIKEFKELTGEIRQPSPVKKEQRRKDGPVL